MPQFMELGTMQGVGWSHDAFVSPFFFRSWFPTGCIEFEMGDRIPYLSAW
jgi:hypothetical protein